MSIPVIVFSIVLVFSLGTALYAVHRQVNEEKKRNVVTKGLFGKLLMLLVLSMLPGCVVCLLVAVLAVGIVIGLVYALQAAEGSVYVSYTGNYVSEYPSILYIVAPVFGIFGLISGFIMSGWLRDGLVARLAKLFRLDGDLIRKSVSCGFYLGLPVVASVALILFLPKT